MNLLADQLRDITPERKALAARRTLFLTVLRMALYARRCGVPDNRLKLALLALRAPEIAVLTNGEVVDLIQYFELSEA